MASRTFIPKIVRVNLLRRHPIALALIALVSLSALGQVPPLVDAASGAPPPDADLVRPVLYTLLAPISNVLDALTFLSLERAKALVGAWTIALALWGLLRRGTLRRRLIAAVLGPIALLLLGVGAAVLPRPVPQLVATDSTLTVMDYHAHTAQSHDGRRGWTLADLAAWHADQGFGASYVTDHNTVFNGGVEDPIRLLPGVEWSVYDQHVIALGAVGPIDRGAFGRDTRAMLDLFAALHRQGAIGIASLPEYWRNHWDDLDRFVAANSWAARVEQLVGLVRAAG